MFNGFLKNNFHSLYHRNYRYFFFGQMISLIGTWMQVMAQAWLVYTLTSSPLKLGIVSATQFLPTLIFALFAGALVDRYSKKKILIITQAIYCIQALVLFYLIHTGTVQYWHILLLTLSLGLASAIDMPARQSFVIELVGRGDVVNAVGLNSAIYNLARILGPAIAGIIMTAFGIEWCFFINGISFITVIFSLVMITVTGCNAACKETKDTKANIFKDVKEGLIYIRKTPLLLKTSLIILFITVVSFNYNVLIPVFAKTVLGLREKGFGILLSSLGVGSLIGALMVSTRGKKNPKGKTLILSSMLVGLCLFALGLVHNIYAASIILGLCGIFNLWFFTNANSILQLNSSDEFRGRVMGVYSMVFAGTIPIGSLISGFVAEKIGADNTFIYAGLIIVAVIMSVQTIRGSIRS
jgi:MFS family permease